ncbi:MAG: SpoIIE family protein phosphatase [Coriobacteriia bacterium]
MTDFPAEHADDDRRNSDLLSQRLRKDVLTLAAISASNSRPSEVAVSLLKAMHDSMNVSMGAIYTYDEPAARLSLLASVGIDDALLDRFRTIDVREGEPALVVAAVLRHQAVTSQDVELDPQREEYLRAAGLRNPTVNIALPMEVAGRVVGTLSFVFDREYPISDDERALYTALGSVVAQTIENSMLLRAEERRAAALETARDIAVLTSITDTWEDFAASALELLCARFKIDTATMYVIDDQGTVLKPVASRGFEAAPLQDMPSLMTEEDHDAARVYRSGLMLVIDVNSSADGEVRDAARGIEEAAGQVSASALILPLDGFRQSEGVLALYWQEPHGYVDTGVEAFKTLAREIATGLENIRLTEKEHRAQQAVCESEERFRALVRASSDVLYVMSPDWKEMRALTSEGFLANTEQNPQWLHDYIYEDDREHVFAVIGEAIRTKSVFELEHRVIRADGTVGWTHSRAVPLLDAEGEITEWFGSADDITKRKTAEHEVERELETVSSLLKTADALRAWVSLDDVLAALTASLLAVIEHTRVTVFLWDTESAEATMASSAGADALPTETRIHLDDLSLGAREALDTRKSTVVDYDALTETERGTATRTGSHLALLVPLVHTGEVVGAIFVDDPGERREFSDREIRLAEGISSQAAVAIESARLYEVEHGIAQTLQETLVVLPGSVEGVTYSSAYECATGEKSRVGGDFVDVFAVGDDVVGITLGDVSGKGIDAAVTTALIRTTLRVHALDGMSPSQACARTNEMMRRFTELESYVTLWFGLLNTRTGQLRYVCAGHPPALLISVNGDIDELESRDPIMGAFDAATFHEWHSVMLQGDRLVLYSDGAIEVKSPQGVFLGMEGWLETVVACHEQPTKDLAPCLMSDVVEYADGVLRDDVAILVVQAPDVEMPRGS